MSIRDHKWEAKRWLNSPNGTKVWSKEDGRNWILEIEPKWSNYKIYVVDDKHAEIRKEWIDKGKPAIQIWDDTFEELDDYNWQEPEWYLSEEYRIKQTEWETPEGENPIPYHAKRIDPDWKFNMNDFYQKRWHIGFYPLDKTYTAELSQLQICVGTHFMSQRAAEQIADALNSGKLKLKNRE